MVMRMTSEKEKADENVLVVVKGIRTNTIHNTREALLLFQEQVASGKVKVLIVLISHISHLM